MTNIEIEISKLLKENTGTHFLDSGGENGRMHQRNQEIDFAKEPRVDLEFFNGEFEYPNVSVFHYLSELLSIDDTSNAINDLLDTERAREEQIHWVDEAEEFVLDFPNVENMRETVNTYNHESNLSQVLVFKTFTIFKEAYVLLQIHGGADVRGGYTQVKCFKLDGYLQGHVDLYGSYKDDDEKDIFINNHYDGYNLTNEDTDEKVEIKEGQELEIDFTIMTETYMYSD